MFSVPFDSGWSAVIDGAAADIEKVNGGFMAVKVPAGSERSLVQESTRGFSRLPLVVFLLVKLFKHVERFVLLSYM